MLIMGLFKIIIQLFLSVLDASCKLTLANTEVTVFINQALGRYVYVSRCDSLEGEFDNGTHQGVPTPYLVVLTIKQCNIQSVCMTLFHSFLFVRSCVRSFVRSFARSFVCSRVRSFVRLFIHTFPVILPG